MENDSLENDADKVGVNASGSETPVEKASRAIQSAAPSNKLFDRALKWTIMSYTGAALVSALLYFLNPGLGSNGLNIFGFLVAPIYALPVLLVISIAYGLYCKIKHHKSEILLPTLGGVMLGIIGGIVICLLILLGTCFLAVFARR